MKIGAKFIGDADPDETGSNMSGDSTTLSVTDAAEFEVKRLGNEVPASPGTPRVSSSSGGGAMNHSSGKPSVDAQTPAAGGEGIMSSAAIVVLQERCANLQAALSVKEEEETKYRTKISILENIYKTEISGLRVELDSKFFHFSFSLFHPAEPHPHCFQFFHFYISCLVFVDLFIRCYT
jgi:hypothetical protein